jgi:hypothetical protein
MWPHPLHPAQGWDGHRPVHPERGGDGRRHARRALGECVRASALLATLSAEPERVFTKRELLQCGTSAAAGGRGRSTRTRAGSTLPVYAPAGFSRAPSAHPWSHRGHTHHKTPALRCHERSCLTRRETACLCGFVAPCRLPLRAGSGTRTRDRPITNRRLYQLSYPGGSSEPTAAVRGRPPGSALPLGEMPVPWKWPADAEGEACAGRPQ